MPESDRWFPAHLVELQDDESWELLRTRAVGRVAYSEREGPVILPVNFVVEEQGTVLFRTSPHSALAQHLTKSSSGVSFQVDDFDEFNQTGWSVLLRGEASVVSPNELPIGDDERPSPWVEGMRTLYVRLTPHGLSGRRLLPS